MKKLILPIISVSLMVQFASAKMTRLQHAHQHGSAKLGLAIGDKNGRLDFKASASSIVGFEHQPKNGREAKLLKMQIDLFNSKINEMVLFAPELGCVFTDNTAKIEVDDKEKQKLKAEHSDFVATFNIKCSKTPIGSKLTFNFQKYFPSIKDIDAAIVASDLQKSVEIKSNGVTVDLSK